MYEIRMGQPEMEEFWNELTQKVDEGKATKDEIRLFNKIGKTLLLLSNNPRHQGLNTHDIDELTQRYGIKVWESYLENNTPAAGRIFWVYGPGRMEITIISLEPHPNEKKSNAYKRIVLSRLNNEIEINNQNH